MSCADPRPRLRAVPDTPHGRTDAARRATGSPHGDATPATATHGTVVQTTAVQFSETVRQVITLARRHGLRPPVYRSPPRLAGVDRSIRRRPNGTVVVAVRRAGRPLAAIQSDVIDGVVAANELRAAQADRFRRAAWAQLEGVPSSAGGRGGTATRGGPDVQRSCAQVA